jgi:hypothetical protein
VLVGGFGGVVRSRQQIADALAVAAEGHQRAAAIARNSDVDPESRRRSHQDGDYLDGVAATLAWVLGEQAEAPITRRRSAELTNRDFKAERVHAEDVIEQTRNSGLCGRPPPPAYGEGVKFTISWLLGDSTGPPRGPSRCTVASGWFPSSAWR